MHLEGKAPVAAVYDIHGNAPALEAALAAADAAGAGGIVVGDDLLLGPMSRETLERLLALGRALFTSGHCDRLVIDAPHGRPPVWRKGPLASGPPRDTPRDTKGREQARKRAIGRNPPSI